MPKWREQYGDPMFLPTMNGDVYLTGQPELVKQIFATKPAVYGPFATEAISGFAGAGSMLVLSGERHRRERKLLMPPFRGSAMKALGPAMAKAARRWLAEASGRPECSFAEVAQSISLEAIIRTVFGVQQDTRVAEFTEAITSYLEVANPLFFFVKAAQNRWFPPWRRFVSVYDRLDALLQTQIDQVRAEGGTETILASMVSTHYEDGSPMVDEEIKGELRTLLFAGHDTTAITLAWAVDHLFRDVALLERVRGTVDALEGTPAAYASCEALENLWRETLRLHPVATEALRTLEAPMQLGGLDLPKGAVVSASISLVHRDPDIYPDPERFDPERFASRSYGPHEYLPFGGGHRRCLGAAFAGYQLQVVLGILIRDYNVDLLDPTPAKVVRKNVTLAPEPGIPAKLTRRTKA